MFTRGVRALADQILNWYPGQVVKKEFESQRFTRFNERPVEFAFVFKKMSEIYPREVLDVGSGTTALPHLMQNCGALVTAIDNVRDYWPSGMRNRHYYIIDDDIVNTKIQAQFDLITCISVLEHIENPDSAVRNLFSLLKPKGYLILTFPYSNKNYVRNVYTLQGSSYGQNSPYITQSFSKAEIDGWVQRYGAIIREQEYWQFWSGDFWTVGDQVIPPKKVGVDEKHQLACLLLQREA